MHKSDLMRLPELISNNIKKEIYRRNYNFWGNIIECFFVSKQQLEWFNYYFQDYLTDFESEISLLILPQKFADTFDSLFSFNVYVSKTGEKWRYYTSSECDERVETPIPPFNLDVFKNKFHTIHGAALETKKGAGLVISGESMAGKTTLLLSLLENGFSFITDDIVVIERNGDRQLLHPFSRPLGIRENTARLFENCIPLRRNHESFETPNGRIFPLHINNTLFSKSSSPVVWKWTVLLEKASSCASIEIGPQTLKLYLIDIYKDAEWAKFTILTWLLGKEKYIGSDFTSGYK